MAQPYPISRETREEAVFLGNGGASYGPFALKIFDADDLQVWTKLVGALDWVKQTVAITKTSNLAFDTFSIAFAANVATTTKIKVISARVHERSAGLMSGVQLSPNALEKEMTKQGTILQELARDRDRAVKMEFGGGVGPTLSSALADGDTLMKDGPRLVAGPNIIAIAAEAEADANRAEAARDIAAGYVSDAISQGNVPIYATIDGMPSITVPIGINAIRVNGKSSAGDKGGGDFIDTNNGSDDTFISGGLTGRTWYRTTFNISLQPAELDVSAKRYLSGVSISEFPGVDLNANDAYDSAPAINAAIQSMYDDGGGVIEFPSGSDIRIQTPIILKHGVTLRGPGGVTPHDPDGRRGAIIRPSANMSAMITQTSLTELLHSAGIVGMTIDGKKSAYTIANLVDIVPVNCTIEYNEIVNGSGNNMRLTNNNNTLTPWINRICRNQITHADGWNVWSEITDSVFSENYVSTSGVGGMHTHCYGNVRITDNQFEIGPILLEIETVGTGTYPISGNMVLGNSFDLSSNIALHYKKGAFGAQAFETGLCEGNRFSNTSGAYDIYIDSNLQYGNIGANNHRASNPTVAHIGFGGANNTGWVLLGACYANPLSTRFSNLPSDTLVISGGGEQRNRLASLLVGTDALNTLLTVFGAQGSTTWRGIANVAALFGITLADQSALGAQVAIGSTNGNTPYVKATKYGASNAVDAVLDLGSSIQNPNIRLEVDGSFSLLEGQNVTTSTSGRARLWIDASGNLKMRTSGGTVKTFTAT